MSRRKSLADIKDFNSRLNNTDGSINSRRTSKRFGFADKSIAEEGPEDNDSTTLEERYIPK
jgi:hypothetical protein